MRPVAMSSVVLAACLAHLARAEAPPEFSPDGRSERGEISDVSRRLAEQLEALRDPHYWDKHSVEVFWREAQTWIEQGADVRVAYDRGLSIWQLAFTMESSCVYSEPPPSKACGGRQKHGCKRRAAAEGGGEGVGRRCDQAEHAKIERRIDWLLAHGVDPNLNLPATGPFSRECYTPLRLAIKAHLKDSVTSLLSHGANPDGTCGDGTTPLYEAAFATVDVSCVCELIRAGASIDLANGRGETPLWAAASFGAEKSARILLDYGANPDVANRDGIGVREVARKRKRERVERLLLRRTKPTCSLCGEPTPKRGSCIEVRK